jgi:hypothetical protein
MTNFITKINHTVDLSRLSSDLDSILEMTSWDPENQIGLRHRPNCVDPWKDSIGSIHDPITNVIHAREQDFNIWNADCPQYTKSILEDFGQQQGLTWGRIRFMRAQPKHGLSMHWDKEPRFHIVLKTNISAIFGECFRNNPVRATAYHMPADGHWYRVDTTREHFVYNGGREPRIHLVCCPVI